MIFPERGISSKLRAAEGGADHPGGQRGFPQGPRAPGRCPDHCRSVQDQREGLRGLPGHGLQRGSIAADF